NRPSPHSHPGRVLLRLWLDLAVGAPPRCEPIRHVFAPGGCSYNHGTTSPVGAPPDRRTASVRTDPAHIRTRGGCSYNHGTPSPVGAPPSVRTSPRPNPLLNLKPDGPLPATLPRARTWQRSCD